MRSNRVLAVAAACVLLSVASPPSSAAPVNYDESVDGDLAWTAVPSDTVVLNLGLGNNRIAGGTTYSIDTIDEDYFGFLVPEGGKVVSISLSFYFPYSYYTSRTLALRDHLTGALIDASYVAVNVGNGEDTASPVVMFSSSLPLMASGTTFNINMGGATWALPGGTLYYEWRIDVRPNAVPEPGTLALLGLGLAGLAFTRRRQQ